MESEEFLSLGLCFFYLRSGSGGFSRSVFLVSWARSVFVSSAESTDESEFLSDLGAEGVEEDSFFLSHRHPFVVSGLSGRGELGNLFVSLVFAFLKISFPLDELLEGFTGEEGVSKTFESEFLLVNVKVGIEPDLLELSSDGLRSVLQEGRSAHSLEDLVTDFRRKIVDGFLGLFQLLEAFFSFLVISPDSLDFLLIFFWELVEESGKSTMEGLKSVINTSIEFVYSLLSCAMVRED